jgi:Na+/H+-dicarboxylate symporter
VPVLVFTAIVASIANLRELNNAARLVWQTLLWFAITALIAVGIGIALGLIIQPGVHTAVTEAAARAPSSTGSWLDFLKGLIPSNIIGLQASTRVTDGSATTSLNFNVLQILMIAIVVGVAALRVGPRCRHVPRLQPLLPQDHPQGPVVGHPPHAHRHDRPARQRRGRLWLGRLAQLGWYAAAIYIGLVLVLFVVYPALLQANGLNPIRYFQSAWPAIQLAFVSRSSIGTLPVTERITEKNLGVPREYASFAVPLGATTKMDGCAAIYPAISAIFVAQFFGISWALSNTC